MMKPIETKCANHGCKKTFPYKKTKKYCSAQCRVSALRKTDGNFSYEQGVRPKIDIATGSIGAAHELLVCADLLKRGYSVFRAQSPSCPCDLILLHRGKIYRVEVRTGIISGAGNLQYPIKPTDMGHFDILAVVQHNGKITYHNTNLAVIRLEAL